MTTKQLKHTFYFFTVISLLIAYLIFKDNYYFLFLGFLFINWVLNLLFEFFIIDNK